MIASEPYLSAYLELMHRVIVQTRALARQAQGLHGEQSDLALEQIADLQDAIHVIAERLNEWERCDEVALRENFLGGYDRKWANKPAVMPISLLEVFEQALKQDAPKQGTRQQHVAWYKFW